MTIKNVRCGQMLLMLCKLAAYIGMSGSISACSHTHGGNIQTDFQTPMIDVRDARAIFAGDSITAAWPTADKQRNTGMPGQNSEMIGRRFAAEIAAGSPRYVHILAGTNDDIRNPAPSLVNIDRMIGLAQARNIPVIVGTIPPYDASKFWQSQYVASFNAALVANVKPLGAIVADYYSAMILPNGQQNAALFKDDGIHPNAAGYQVMDLVLKDAISLLPPSAAAQASVLTQRRLGLQVASAAQYRPMQTSMAQPQHRFSGQHHSGQHHSGQHHRHHHNGKS